MLRLFSRVLAIVLTLAGSMALVLAPSPAHALTTSTTFVYNGSNDDTKTIIDTGLVYVDGCVIGSDPVTCFPDDFPGTAWFRFRAGVHSTVVTAASADYQLNGPDSFRADSTAPFTSTLKAVDGAGKEVTLKTTPFVNLDIAYDAPLANCPKDTIQNTTDLDNADTNGCLNIVGHTGNVDITTVNLLQQDATLPASGTRNLSQTASSPSLDVGALVGLPAGLLGVHLDFVTNLALTATQGYHADRVIASSSAPATPLASGPLSWPNENPQADNVAIPCAATVGDNLVYKLTNNRWDGTGDASGDLNLVVEIPVISDPSFTVATVPLFNASVFGTANDFSQVLGPIESENKAPTVGLAPIAGGNEGSPIAFSVVGTGASGAFDNCDPTGASLSYHWTFDDGGEAFGRAVNHAFPDNNGSSPRSGHVVVTDRSGNATNIDFSVPVANVPPVVVAEPDTTAAWGVPVAFNATATDPGSADQATLGYRWEFGDGSPSATAGPSVSHPYSQPGDYTATLTVCDKDGGCGSDTRVVHVRKRTVSLGYVGDHSGTFDTAATFAGALVDEFGQAVPGRPMTFAVGPEAGGSAMTNGAGQATTSHVIGLDAGTFTATAAFGGDGLYEAANNATAAFAVARKATVTTYTGALSGGPNKTIALSATLTDSAGKVLAGRTVTFALGSQSATATTNANGVAATSLKLAQKNGTYPLTAAFTPAGADSGRYVASGDSETFKLQAK